MAEETTTTETPKGAEVAAETTKTTTETTKPTGGTLAESVDDVPAKAPPTWPDNWRELGASGDEKVQKLLNRYSSPQGVIKALIAAQKKISSGEIPKPKPEGEDPEAMKAWRAENNIPEKPDDYLSGIPDGVVIGEEDKDISADFLKAMHAKDVPAAIVHDALSWYIGIKEKQAEQQNERDKKFRAGSEDVLREEWGDEYRGNLNGIVSVINQFGDDKLRTRMFAARMADGTPLGDDPDFLRFMASVSREINPRGTVVPTGGQTVTQAIEAEIEQLEKEMADTKGRTYDYYKNPRKQERYRELLDLRDRHKARAV